MPKASTDDFRRRFTVDEFQKMDDAGVFAPDERIELIDGDFLVMSRIGSPHRACVTRLNRGFLLRLGDRAMVAVQDPIHLDAHSEPEPDLAIARPREDDYQSAHPGPADLFLVIEVMDTSGPSDRAHKLPLYARFAIREVWLVDLAMDFIEIHRRPVAGVYTEQIKARRGQTISPEAFPDIVLTVESILSRPES